MAKYIQLCNEIESHNKIAIAFSGGVDSTLLIHLGKEVLGSNAVAVTIVSDFYPTWELSYAEKEAKKIGIKHKIIEIDPLAIKEISKNPPDRCYACKKIGLTLLKDYAENLGISYICDGSCLDDLGDYRPGFLAVEELGFHSPFIDYEINKNEIKIISQELGIEGWARPSCSCLASRIPYNEEITKTKLQLIENAEEYLHTLGIPEARVRLHNNVARIEVFEQNIQKVFANKDIISHYIKSLGATYVSVELDGYRTGSMNKSLQKKE